ncbi:MAG: glutamate racemase [Parvibaculaceae bacterium]|jgi:glutamate racemase|tara:strand:+ start:454 stop:1218 length:765 start_codon:yes stop_codon:yes gene_type:complete
MTRVLTLDSGLGGLSVLREITRLLPTLECDYIADRAAFPYGDWEEDALIEHLVTLVSREVERRAPDGVVIACNTASTLILDPLRSALDIPIVGTVPAIKPAAKDTQSGLISVLATPGTVKRDYTHDLIAAHAPDAHVTLVGAPTLAAMAEAILAGHTVDPDLVRSEIAPCFQTEGERRTDVVVLGCTHYPFLRQWFEAQAPWPVQWLDPAPAIARRLQAVLTEAGAIEGSGQINLVSTLHAENIETIGRQALQL